MHFCIGCLTIACVPVTLVPHFRRSKNWTSHSIYVFEQACRKIFSLYSATGVELKACASLNGFSSLRPPLVLIIHRHKNKKNYSVTFSPPDHYRFSTCCTRKCVIYFRRRKCFGVMAAFFISESRLIVVICTGINVLTTCKFTMERLMNVPDWECCAWRYDSIRPGENKAQWACELSCYKPADAVFVEPTFSERLIGWVFLIVFFLHARWSSFNVQKRSYVCSYLHTNTR